jgi:parallel beta-helix repeat protein
MKRVATYVLAICFLVFYSSAYGADWYVDCDVVGGSDNGTSWANAWDDLNEAQYNGGAGSVGQGDTVHVKGTCTTKVNFAENDSGALGSVITYVVDSGDTMTLDGPAGGTSQDGVDLSGVDYITFDGWTIIDWEIGIYFDSAGGALLSKGITIQNCIFTNNGKAGISTAGGEAEDLIIDSNTLYDNSIVEENWHAIYISDCADCTISNNEIFWTGATGYGSGNGIQLQSKWVDSHEITGTVVEKNKIYDLKETLAGLSGDGIIFNDFSNTPNHVTGNIIRNNLIWDVEGSCFYYRLAQNPGNKIYNNTCYSNDNYGFEALANDSNLEIKNNIFYQNGSGGIYDCASCQTATNQTTDPSFQSVDDANADFLKIQTGSSAKDAGTTLADVTDDYFGTARPQPSGGSFDIGAHEFADPCTHCGVTISMLVR